MAFRYKTGLIPFTCLIIIALCALLAGCDVNVSSSNFGVSSGSPGSQSGATCQSNCTMGAGTQGVQVFVEPEAGSQVITNAIDTAQKSVWLEIYLLTNRNVIRSLEEAAHRGVDVRVMLEAHPYGSGGVSPAETMDRLQAAGVQVKPTNPAFALTHEKGMIIDGRTAFIMTANFTLAALGGSRSTKNREYGIIDNNQQDVQAVAAIFNADWNRTTPQFNAPNLVVSPVNSRSAFESLINSAHHTLLIEAEEMNDSDIEAAIASAAKRGVQVQVILPSPSGSSSDSESGGDSNNAGIQVIKQGGTQVREDSTLYMHAKMMVVDGQRAFVGSENISTASLDKNRELGVIVSDQNVLNTLQQTFQQDWGASQSV